MPLSEDDAPTANGHGSEHPDIQAADEDFQAEDVSLCDVGSETKTTTSHAAINCHGSTKLFEGPHNIPGVAIDVQSPCNPPQGVMIQSNPECLGG